MLRSIGAIAAGVVVWAVLWLTGSAIITASLTDGIVEGAPITDAGLLSILLGLSVLISLIAGWTTSILAPRAVFVHTFILAILQLAQGVFVQAQYWNLMPLGYHVTFLGLLVPMILLGGRIRAPSTAPAPQLA
ncbi:MAG: hypothetical protein KDA32_15410 [Phycisphaerales bacterium]|nr:hypothetical protein [Phycisphaerales bacterium]